MDLAETDDHLVLRADLPGMTRDDISIEVKDGVLSLPEGVDADEVGADFDNGVLEIRIPKPEERKPFRVAIGAGDVEGKATEKE